MKTVTLIFGGVSPEHEISILSARSFYQALLSLGYEVRLIGITKTGKWVITDETTLLHQPVVPETGLPVSLSMNPNQPGLQIKGQLISLEYVIPILHGQGGEDGTIQGLFELMGVSYLGCDMESSVCCMNKIITKQLLEAAHIEVTPWVCLEREMRLDKQALQALVQSLSYPLFVKPAHGGSSIGISKVKQSEKLESAVQEALLYDREALIEQGIQGREIECSVLGDYETINASLPGEICPEREFYDYEAKYIEKTTRLMVPAKLTGEQIQRIQQIAIAVFKTLRCYGMARVDFFLDEDTNKLFVNEVNTIPGFTSISLYPKLWEVEGLSYQQLVQKLIDLGSKKEPIQVRCNQGGSR